MPKESKGKEIRLEYHFEATLTIRRTLPLYSLRLTSFPRISCHQIQLITKKKKEKKKANSKQLFSQEQLNSTQIYIILSKFINHDKNNKYKSI